MALTPSSRANRCAIAATSGNLPSPAQLSPAHFHWGRFSTSCHLEVTTGVVPGPLALPFPLLLDKENCGQTKRPCKQPLGPCEVRRQKEEEQRKERAIHIPPRPKKAAAVQLAKKKHPNCHPQGPKKPKRPDEGNVDVSAFTSLLV